MNFFLSSKFIFDNRREYFNKEVEIIDNTKEIWIVKVIDTGEQIPVCGIDVMFAPHFFCPKFGDEIKVSVGCSGIFCKECELNKDKLRNPYVEFEKF